MKSFLKWAGGKSRVLPHILPVIPPGKRFVEPFAGSAVVYLNTQFEKALVADINKDLVTLYQFIQSDGFNYIQYLKSFFVPDNNSKENFMKLRDKFNSSTDPSERAALFLYLNRHAFNGLIRFNSKGIYNVPFGSYKTVNFPGEALGFFFRKTQITETKFAVSDFRQIFPELQKGDVVYADPPYVPLTATSNFTAYSGNVFGPQDQKDLATMAETAQSRGIPVILSNHDTPETRVLYQKAKLLYFDVQRNISSKSDKRESASELLAIYKV